LPGIHLVILSGIVHVLTCQGRCDYHLSVLTQIPTLINLLDLAIALSVSSPISSPGTRRLCPDMYLTNLYVWISTHIMYSFFVEIWTPPQFGCVRRRIVFVAVTIHQEI
jgi:hypothetical protein